MQGKGNQHATWLLSSEQASSSGRPRGRHQRPRLSRRRSVESAAAQVVGNDDIRDRVEHKLDVGRVRGTGHVAVDLFGGGFVLGFELRLDVGGRLPVLLGTCTHMRWHTVKVSPPLRQIFVARTTTCAEDKRHPSPSIVRKVRRRLNA